MMHDFEACTGGARVANTNVKDEFATLDHSLHTHTHTHEHNSSELFLTALLLHLAVFVVVNTVVVLFSPLFNNIFFFKEMVHHGNTGKTADLTANQSKNTRQRQRKTKTKRNEIDSMYISAEAKNGDSVAEKKKKQHIKLTGMCNLIPPVTTLCAGGGRRVRGGGGGGSCEIEVTVRPLYSNSNFDDSSRITTLTTMTVKAKENYLQLFTTTKRLSSDCLLIPNFHFLLTRCSYSWHSRVHMH